MKKIFVIGIGAGDPDFITVQAINALKRTDVFFVFDKGPQKNDLVRIRREICEPYVKDRPHRFVEVASPPRDRAMASYTDSVAAWHREKRALFKSLIAGELKDGECGAFLAWGDPSLYDSTIRILHALADTSSPEFDYEVIPGISSIQALVARHKIALNAIGEPVLVTTGRKLAERGAVGADSIAVMLDDGSGLEAVAGEDLDIFWGAYLGTEDEVLVSGKVRDVIDEIRELRRARKAEKGWIMDTYLLRREGQ